MHSYLQVAIYFTGSYPYEDSGIESTRPIHIASGLGRTVAVQFLVEGGAEINARDEGDRTSLHLAAAEGHIETVQSWWRRVPKLTRKTMTAGILYTMLLRMATLRRCGSWWRRGSKSMRETVEARFLYT